MNGRGYWIEQLEKAWNRRSVVWLYGVRRSGKTMLCKSLSDTEYLDCELPRVRRELEDPEAFWKSIGVGRVVLDEVQRLSNPSEVLKIAADHFPNLKVVATGSSTLQASAKFRDTLTGRKAELWLTPMIAQDLVDLGSLCDDGDLKSRLRRGGLPPFFLNPNSNEQDYEEWLDSFWARDIQELFRLERRWGFQRFLELLLTQSGGIFEATRFSAPCEISRTTVANYLDVMESTRVVNVVRAFSSRRSVEITSAPKVYGFDTGFVTHFRGWSELRPEDWGNLWEHYVLNEIQARTLGKQVFYWRDKRGHEIDFVLPGRNERPTAIECKWTSDALTTRNLKAFRHQYPDGENWLLAPDVTKEKTRTVDGLEIQYLGIEQLASKMGNPYG